MLVTSIPFFFHSALKVLFPWVATIQDCVITLDGENGLKHLTRNSKLKLVFISFIYTKYFTKTGLIVKDKYSRTTLDYK